ncbi:hypothetical protein M404DRAFT_991470 [Pisolithus tinctorius Marx 270]|uniref:Uncharacterized protein n=1 Tax=Pisolithus tinctorius Marx 270 TaxID=870435 RepID=A0A0C3PYI3_PISTI|nr:hypothetical protein M404DRAFT_991470 [Pisolithus tinctorius Marx 270]
MQFLYKRVSLPLPSLTVGVTHSVKDRISSGWSKGDKAVARTQHSLIMHYWGVRGSDSDHVIVRAPWSGH